MTCPSIHRRLAAFCLLAACVAPARADVVTDWNEIACNALRTERLSVIKTGRAMAMVQLAVLDAVVAIDPRCEPYLAPLPPSPDASMEAAVATAAHDVLISLVPARSAMLDGSLAATMANIPAGAARDEGIALGAATAAAILADRANDGSATAVNYVPQEIPGHWRPTLPGLTPAIGANWGGVRPFVIASSSIYRVPPPPDMTSQPYADAINEVKEMGRRDSSVRTADQTQIGIFWASDRPGMGPPVVFKNRNAREVAAMIGNDPVENARMFALVNVAMADAGIAAWESKYYYNVWRPITAVQEAESDGNPATTGEPDWQPLGAPGAGEVPDFTPAFPSYPSGHAVFGAAAFVAMALYTGSDTINCDLSCEELPGVIRHYARFSDMTWDNAISRIYLGIHFRFDADEGNAMGDLIGREVYSKLARPLVSAAKNGWLLYP